jgi:poly(A) polymerase
VIAPTIVSRADHSISRQRIDPDALKVLYRLRKFNHTAYLVGGGVRDLLLDRRPKDFDIGTSAHPNELKRLFRNCWIIGRRFRLAHIKFGSKTIEVATFRRQVPVEAQPAAAAVAGPGREPDDGSSERDGKRRGRPPIRRDNTFGTPEEDAFRRDFTINGLFYDIQTFAVIDYVGGMADLRRRLIRCIGDPDERFVEDPVRMLRAISFAARLDFRLDAPVREGIARHRAEIRNASPARLVEELYKLLRSGAATRIFKRLSRTGLLRHIAPEVNRPRSVELWRSLEALDAYRLRFDEAPDTLTNAILLGSLVAPVQKMDLTPHRRDSRGEPPRVALGDLPVARRDIEHLRQVLALQPLLGDPDLPPRRVRGILGRASLADALTWLEIHGNDPDTLARWQDLVAHGVRVPRRRRRRRRGRRRSRRTPAAE